MPTITGFFDARRPAEVAVERLVQDYGLDRKAVTAMAEGPENTSGTVLSGNDAVAAAEGEDPGGQRAGRIAVTADVPDEMAERAEEAFRAEGASEVRRA
jgi:hypothetical protein